MLSRWSDWPCSRSRWPRLLAVVDAAAQPPVCSTTGCGTKQHGFYRIGARRPAAMSKATDGAGVGSASTHNTRGMSARRAFSVDASSAASAPRRVVSAGWRVAQCHFQCQRFGRESGTNRRRLNLRCALRAGIESAEPSRAMPLSGGTWAGVGNDSAGEGHRQQSIAKLQLTATGMTNAGTEYAASGAPLVSMFQTFW